MMAIYGDPRGGIVSLWSVVAPCGRVVAPSGRWSHFVDGGRTLLKMIAPYGRWSRLLNDGRTLWTVVAPCGR